MNIIITGYHHPQSVITQYTRPNSPLQCHSECLAADQSGPSVPLSANQIARSGPGLHLAALLAAPGEAALWCPDTECCHTLTSLARKTCIEIHLSTRFRLQRFFQNNAWAFLKTNTRNLYSVWMQRLKSMSVVVKGRVSYIDLKSGEFHVKWLKSQV